MRKKVKKGQLYRHYDKDGFLLYVGMSSSFLDRQVKHKRSHWFEEIATITVEHYDTRQEALDAERLAICTENPKHNLKRPTFTGPVGRELNYLVQQNPKVKIPWDKLTELARDYMLDEAPSEFDHIQW